MTNEVTTGDGLTFWVYRSSAVEPLSEGDLHDILSSARQRNQTMSLTGCLHLEDGLFFQWLEGPAASMRQVMDLIMADPRHQDVTVLGQGPLPFRKFQDWRMRFSDRDQVSLMDWFASADISTVDRKAYVGGVVTFLTTVAG